MESKRLNRIAQDLVLKQVVKDKYESLVADKQHEAASAKIEGAQDPQGGKHAELDDDAELYRLRELKMKKLKEEQEKWKKNKEMGNGSYREVSEDEFARLIVNCRLAICHFFSEEFSRCKIMDSHLSKLAPEHVETTFVKLNAYKANFFADKFRIRALPSLVLFVNGNASRILVGFDAFGGRDNFETSKLRNVLFKCKVIEKWDQEEFSDGSHSDDE